MKRIVNPEWLDALSPGNPLAMRSRRDLCRVNAWMGNHGIMLQALQTGLSGHAPGQITELGAGDGNFLLRVAQNTAARWPNVKAMLLDRQKTVTPQTLESFASLNWRAEVVVADVFDWLRTPAPAEIIITNLFLHHFDNTRLPGLFRAIAGRTRLFIAAEPRRALWPLFCSRLLWAIGCSAVTLHDAAVSVHAGFSNQELSAFWPDKQNWQLTEQHAGLFSHLFIARKIGQTT